MTNSQPYNIFETALKQFDRSAEILGLDHSLREFLRVPMREYHFSLPIHMDDGKTITMQGYKVQYNDSRGPTKGGIRFHPQETIDTIRALAMWMTWKCAVTNLPLGGGSSGVACDTHLLSQKEQEQICRGFVRQTAYITGPDWDISGPDLMTGPQHMLWMLDEYETIHRTKSPGFITGKPINHAGSKGRKEAPGYGVVIAIREALKDMGTDITKTRASFQGFGSVGQHAVKLYHQMGGVVQAISCLNHLENTSFTFRKKEGIDFDQIISITDRFGEIDKTKAVKLGYECLPGEAWIEQPVDILVPAAMEHQIRIDNVEKISTQVKIIAEAANGPTDPEVDPILNNRGILVLPDILANSGGVICSYFEQVQGNMNYFWSKDEVLSKLDSHLTSVYIDISNYARSSNLPMRDAVYNIAVDRVAQACQERGWVSG